MSNIIQFHNKIKNKINNNNNNNKFLLKDNKGFRKIIISIQI